MNAFVATRLLRISDEGSGRSDQIAILGRDIRTSPEKIARYCVTSQEPIYEDLATLVESMAFWDRWVVRRRTEGWTRDLPIQVPVYELGQFQRGAVVKALTEAAWFLTGDRWNFDFVVRKGPVPIRQGTLALPQAAMKHVVPFSDGLDSFAQAKLSVHDHGRESVMLVRSGLGKDHVFPGLVNLRVPRRFSGRRMREVSYRTRPLVFYTLAAIGAVITRADSVVIGENGQGSIGPACLPFSDEWWFRSAHPAFIQRWSAFLELILDQRIQFEQPQLWHTKGEVLTRIRDMGLLTGWEQTNSCSTRPKDRYGHRGCGICGGCLLRAVAAHAAGLPGENNAFDVHGSEDIAVHRDGQKCRMTHGERAVAVRSIAAMAEFACLADVPSGVSTILREARLIEPADPAAAETKLRRLLRQHQSEWNRFINSLPERSWVREIAGQL